MLSSKIGQQRDAPTDRPSIFCNRLRLRQPFMLLLKLKYAACQRSQINPALRSWTCFRRALKPRKHEQKPECCTSDADSSNQSRSRRSATSQQKDHHRQHQGSENNRAHPDLPVEPSRRICLHDGLAQKTSHGDKPRGSFTQSISVNPFQSASSAFHSSLNPQPFASIACCAAANLAIGIRRGLQLT